MDVQCVERLAYTDLRFFASRTAKTNDAHYQVRFVSELLINQFLLYLRPVAEMDAERCSRVDATCQVLIELFCQEGHKWCEQGEQRSQALIKCQVCRQFVIVEFRFPDALATAAQVPVGEVLQECLQDFSRCYRVVLLQTVGNVADSLLQLRND